jgi:hypothetical protein
MSPFKNLRLWALGGLGCLTLLTSLAAVIALNSAGEASLGPLTLMRIAAGYDRRAEFLLAGDRGLKADARAKSARLSRRALAEYPYDTSDWLRLAYVDALGNGSLSPAGLQVLKRSYDLVAIDSFVGLWRVRFALENSQSLSPDLRGSVRNEASALWKNGENRSTLREMASTIRNPAGRLSIALWLNRLDTPVAK